MALELYDFETGSMSQYDTANAWVHSPGVKAYSAITPAIQSISGYDVTLAGTQGKGGYIDGVVKRAGSYSWHHVINYPQSGDSAGTPSGPANPSVYYTPFPFKGWGDPRLLSAWHDASTGAQFSYGFSFRLPAASDPVPWIATPGWGDFFQFHTANPNYFSGSIIKLNLRGTGAVPLLQVDNFGGQGSYGSSGGHPYCFRGNARTDTVISAITLGAWYDVVLRVKWGTNGTAGANAGDAAGQTGSLEIWYRKEGDGAFTKSVDLSSVPTTTFAKSGSSYVTEGTLSGTVINFCRTFLDLGLYHQWDGNPGQTNHVWYDCVIRSTLSGDTGLNEVLGYFNTVEAITGGGSTGTGTAAPTSNYLGNTDLTAVSFSGMTVNQKRMCKFTLATDTVDVSALGARVQGTSTGTNLMKFVLYSDSAGSPNALLATSSEVTVTGTDTAAWVEASVTPTRLTPGDYWLGTITGPGTSSGTRAQIGTIAGAVVFKSNADTYSDGPTDPAGTMTTTIASDLQMAIYAKYTVASGDSTAPSLGSAEANGVMVTLFYDEGLDSASVPATTAFSRSLNGGAGANPTSVAILVDTVILTFSVAAVQSDTVTISYTAPGSNKLRDLAPTPNNAANLSAQQVTNLTGPRVVQSTGRIVAPGSGRLTSIARTIGGTRNVGVGGGGG